MKKVYLLFMFLVGFLFVPLAGVYAAGIVAEEVFDQKGIEVYFYSVAALAGLVITATEFLKRMFNSSGGWTEFLSWFVGVALAFVGWFFKIGIFEDISVYWVVGYGFAAGLIANNIFDSNFIESVINAFKGIKKKD